MPELPEVETIVNALKHPIDWPFPVEGELALQPGIVGRKITHAEVLWDRTVAIPDVESFKHQISGLSVRGVARRGKFVLIDLAPYTLLIHLRMSGDLRVVQVDVPLLAHDRLAITFEDGTKLVFNDTRKFGRVWLVKDPKAILGSLGPDPFAPDLEPATFYAALQKKHSRIKPLLLDQRFIAGLGNIYSDEALFRAKIHPLSLSNRLTPSDASHLLAAIREVFEEAIERNGSSIDWVYRGGSFQNHFKVYQCTGEACEICGTPIQRIVLGQRSTHFCPHCQLLTPPA